MSFYYKKISKKAGLPPGTLIHVGDEKTDKVTISVMEFGEDYFEERVIDNLKAYKECQKKDIITWINVDGIHQMDIVEETGAYFNIHPLVLEDIVNTGQRPKMENYGSYIYLVLKMIYQAGEEDEIMTEQVSLILKDKCIISFQEKEADVFTPIRERIRSGKGRIRKMGADYLAYALIDAIVDNYFLILEKAGDQLEDIEEELLGKPTPDTLQSIHKLKRDAIFLRRSVWPLRELISGLEKEDTPLIRDETLPFLMDVYDHTILVIDTIESTRDMASGMLDIYLSSASNRMNEIMKVLTIIATIFIPLTFIAGIYGMNFKYMPELDWHWGYFTVLFVMVILGIFMVRYFKKNHWL